MADTVAAAYVDQAVAAEPLATWPAPMARDAFYGLAGIVSDVIGPHSEADEAALLVSFLTAFGNCIGRGAYYEVEADQHRTNLFTTLVGDTGKGRKGVSWSQTRKLFAEVDEGWTYDHVKAGLSSGEGLIWHLRDDLELLDKRLLVQESEFASILRRMEREGSTLSAVLREAWDGRKLSLMTKNQPAIASDTHISVLSHITVDELRRYLTRTELVNGFGNRFVFYCVRRSKCLPFGGKIDLRTFEELAGIVGETVKFASEERKLAFDPEARQLWAEWYPELSEGRPGLFGAIIGRAEAQVVRYALIYALLDCAQAITADHLLAAAALWDYAERSAAFIFGDKLGDVVADQALAEIQAAGEAGISKTVLTRKLGSHPRDRERLDAALVLLEACQRIAKTEVKGEGRPETRYTAR